MVWVASDKDPSVHPPPHAPRCNHHSSAPARIRPHSPRQALPTDRVGRRRAVGLLDAVDEAAGEAGLAAVMPPAVLKLPGRAGNALRIPPAAVATVLQNTNEVGCVAAARSHFRSRSGTEGNGVPSLGAKGGGVTAHAKGPQNPAKSRHHQSSSDGYMQGSRLLPSRGPPAVFREEESSSSDVPWEALLAGGTPLGTWVGNMTPSTEAGLHPPAAASCSHPSSVQPGWAAQLRSGPRTGGEFRFPLAKRKEGNPSSNLKSLPTSYFHRLALLPRVSETVHRPFPPSPSSSQHART